jgi:hypothetical protein
MSAHGRYCCKTLCAQVNKNFEGRGRDFRVKMWGTSSLHDKLMGHLAKAIEATQINGYRSDPVFAEKIARGDFGLLQQYLPEADFH